VTVVADQQDGAGKDFFVDARAVLGGRRRIAGCKTSGDYDSLLFKAMRNRAARGPAEAPRNVMLLIGSVSPYGRAESGGLFPMP